MAWERWGSLALAGAIGLLSLPAVADAAAGQGRAASPTALPAVASPLPATVRLKRGSQAIPPSFLGLSVETNELLDYVREGAVFDRAVGLMRSAAGAPIVLRVGGKSADDAYWRASPAGAPPWVFELGDGWTSELAALARRDRLRVMLDLNLAVHSPSMAASFAAAALAALGHTDLAGFSIGNEPDLFRGQPGLERERVSSTTSSARTGWTQVYSPGRYRADYLAYARALAVAAPGVGLAGPEAARSSPGWLRALSGVGPLGPSEFTVHRYPLSYCWPAGSFFYPRVSTLLAERSSHGLAFRLRGAVLFAHRRHRQLWVSELNSVSCAGNLGVSDSFASALWGPDALFELIRAGVDGVNLHLRPQLPNAPFLLRHGSIRPQPELYGLAMFAQMLGPGARRVILSSRHPRALHLKAWAVRSALGTSVLLINKGRRTAEVSVRPARGQVFAPAQIEPLRARSPFARSGITYGGRFIGHDARWHGRLHARMAKPSGGSYGVRVGGFSALLLKIASS
jgi:hypothetical protein